MSYKGLVVGGHLDGEWRSHDLPKFTVSIPLGGSCTLKDGSLFCWDGDGGSRTYVHADAAPVCEFWVPEGKDAAWAMMELIRCYREYGPGILFRATQSSEHARLDY
jgi:hypothetical protein